MSRPSARICMDLVPNRKGVQKPMLYVNGRPILVPSSSYPSPTTGRLAHLLEEFGGNLGPLEQSGHRLRLQPKNTDLIASPGHMLARGTPEEIIEFLSVHLLPMARKQAIYEETITALEHHPFRYVAASVRKYLGIDIPTDLVTGSSPDYEGLTEYLFDGDPNAALVGVPLSGNRAVDEQVARRALLKLGGRLPSEKEMHTFVWHHAWAKLVSNGELWCRMQLVRKDVHEKIYIASLKGMLESLEPDVQPIAPGDPDFDFWTEALGEIQKWDGKSPTPALRELPRRLFQHVGAVANYRLFYPGVRYDA